jgi:hypothetical protein
MNNGNNMEIENTTYQEIDFAPKIGINWSPTDESGVVIFTMQKAVVVGGELKQALPRSSRLSMTQSTMTSMQHLKGLQMHDSYIIKVVES